MDVLKDAFLVHNPYCQTHTEVSALKLLQLDAVVHLEQAQRKHPACLASPPTFWVVQ